MIKRLFIIITLLILAGCSPKIIPAGRDSVVTEIRTEYIERVDTVTVELPVVSEKVTIRDTVSFLSNKFAKSKAEYSGGFLYHDLVMTGASVDVPVKTKEIVRDSVVYVESERVVSVKEPMSKFVKFQIAGFWVLAVLVLLYVAYKVKRFISF